jgi:two-component system nitrogen regulation response regulator NtrX
MSRRILIVDDEAAIRKSLSGVLEDEGYEAVTAESGEEGLERAEAADPDLVLLDVWLPGMDGIETLRVLKERFPALPVLIMSGHGTIETAVRATKLGAYDFIEKPLNLDKVLLSIEHALNATRLAEENLFLRAQAKRGREMIGESGLMRALREQIRLIAPTRATVLITGENGTGKELVAQAIHAASPRAASAFVETNCAAIPETLIESELFGHEKGAFTGAANRRRGKFDLADGGTLFLDEIGDMSLPTQAKILRVLQEMRYERVGGSRTYEVDVRVIAATNKDLEEEIKAGRFREDLYFRLNVIPVVLPPLRERKEDIPLLANHFIEVKASEYGKGPMPVRPEAMALLAAYDWPGNVRELKNIAERMVIMNPGGPLEVRHVPPVIRAAVGAVEPQEEAAAIGDAPFREARRDFERRYILGQLEKSGWNVSLTASRIGFDRSGLYKKMKELEIEVPEPQR